MNAARQVIEEAYALIDSGRPEAAEPIARGWLAARPDNAEPRHLLGLIAQAAGRLDEAAGWFAEAIERDGANPAYHNSLGLARTDLGDLPAAIAAFRMAILFAPGFAAAHSNLGAALRASGHWAEAEASLQRATAIDPSFSPAWYNLGLLHRSLGDAEQAVDDLRSCLAADRSFAPAGPALADLLSSLGQAGEAAAIREGGGVSDPLDDVPRLIDQGRHDEAADACRAVLRSRPNLAEAHHLLSIATLCAAGLDESARHAEEAVRLAPGLIEGHCQLGLVRLAQGRIDEAATTIDAVLAAAPGHVDAWCLAGRVELARGRLEAADVRLRRATSLRPFHPEALALLGVAWQRLDQVERAEAALREAVRHAEGSPTLLVRVGHAAQEAGRSDLAVACFRRALDLQPGFAPAAGPLGFLLSDQGRNAEAATLLDTALGRRADPRLRVLRATLLPPVYRSLDDLESHRAALIENLDRLQRDGVRLDAATETVPTLFYLAYQGREDRAIHETLASLVIPPALPPVESPRRRGKIRVGFLSRHLTNHTIGQLLRGTIARLDRADFEVFVLSAATTDDQIGAEIRRAADQFVRLPLNLGAARAAALAAAVDILIFTDIGMDAFTSTLAHARLAPVQCAFWGHPVTTGIPTIDDFLSAADLEIPDADAHYSERLVRLPRLPIFYERPAARDSRAARSGLGLPTDGHLYACPQSLFKIHPEFDAILAAILRGDPRGRLILLRSWQPHWEELLRRRFAETMPDVLDRVHFAPRADRDGFLDLNAVVDVLLDPLHFGGGNTSYEALALGTPIVTLPSTLLRGRITHALYAQMGHRELIARTPEHYVELALRLGTDAAERERVRRDLFEAAGGLFDDRGAVAGLEDYLRSRIA